MKFKYLEHTADIKFEAYGNNLKEAFSNAALAVFNILLDTNQVKSIEKHEVKIKAKRKQSLLYDFIEELLFLIDTKGFLLSKVENMKIKDNTKDENGEIELSCTVYGDAYQNYETHGDIKAATYNDMEIIEDNPTEDGKIKLVMVVDV